MIRERTFFHADTRAKVVAAVKEIEGQSSAEVVVAVRGASGSYRDVDYLFGFAAALAMLGVLLFDSHPFAIEGMPLGVVGAFVAGAALSANVLPLRRLLTTAARRESATRQAAKAAFVDLGISRTRGRSGILVFVSLFERQVAAVPDVGIDAAKLGPAWTSQLAVLEGALARDVSVGGFLDALRAIGPVLGAGLPRQADDVNELPDEVA
jgi:putative membrane protein